MGTYLMMLYVSLEQEKAVKTLFTNKGWGFKKPDLSMTTDKLGPLSVDDDESDSEEEVSGKGRARSRPAAREASKRTAAVKTIKQSPPAPKSAKKTTKVRVQLRKGGKKSTENAEFQEILEEAELITASINPADDEGEESTPFTVKVERDMLEDSDYDGYGEDGEFNDEDMEEMDDDYDDVTPSTSYLEAEADAESTDMSQMTTSTNDTPKPAKRRKVTKLRPTVPPVDMEDLEAMGDLSPIKDDKDYDISMKQYGAIVGETKKQLEPSDVKEDNLSEHSDSKEDNSDEETNLLPTVNSSSAVKSQKHLCEACGKSYLSKRSLRRHVAIHTGNRSLCYICAKQFTNEYEVKRHIQAAHFGIRYQCDQCESSYKTKCGLKYHKSVHLGDYKFICSICSRGFNYKADFEDHMAYHEGVKRHKCGKCEMYFCSRSNMIRHLRQCGKLVGRSNNCGMCGKCFKTKRYLNEHVHNVHENKSVWQCSCGVDFRYRSSLYKHKAKKGHV